MQFDYELDEIQWLENTNFQFDFKKRKLNEEKKQRLLAEKKTSGTGQSVLQNFGKMRHWFAAGFHICSVCSVCMCVRVCFIKKKSSN